MWEMLMRLDAGYFAYFKLMHANVFTTSVALIIRYLARSCDASVRQHERGRRKEGKKRRCLPFYSLWTTTIFSHAPVSQKLFSKNFHSKLLKTDMQTLVAIANTEIANNNPCLSRQSRHYGNLAESPRYFIDVVRCWWCKFTLHASCSDVSSSSTHVNERS